MSSFAIATTLKQSLDHTLAFLHYHARLKPALFLLFFDQASDPAAVYAEHLPNTQIFRCDHHHWQTVLGRMPEKMGTKQIANLNHALRVCKERQIRWLISIDSDELLFSEGDINGELSRLDPEVEVLNLRPLEAVHSALLDSPLPFDSDHYRVLADADNAWVRLMLRLAGPNPSFTRQGFLGHVEGKSFYRTDHTERIASQHVADFTDHRLAVSLRSQILHHDCVSFAEWQKKWRRRVTGETVAVDISPQRRNQHELIAGILSRNDERRLRQLYCKWFVYAQPQRWILAHCNLLRRICIDRTAFSPLTD